jgi:hypothetical protein
VTGIELLRYSADQERVLAEQCESKAIREGHLAKYLIYSAMADILDGPRKQEFFAIFGIHIPSPPPKLTLV